MSDPRTTTMTAGNGQAGEREKLLALFEQAPGFLCFFQGRGHVFELANQAYRKLVGNRTLVGKPIREALPELAGQGYFELLDRIYETAEPFVGRNMRWLLCRSEGGELTETFVDCVYQPILDKHGRVEGILVQGNDVTAARCDEMERQKLENRYRALFESIDDGYCLMQLIFDAQQLPVDYRFLETNAAFEEHTGLRNAVGKTARELVPNLDETWFRLYGKVALTGESVRFENHAPAMQRWFDVYAIRVGDPAQRLVALVFKNVTARKAAEARLSESEERFRNMADHAPVMLWVTDADGLCIYLNKLWYDTTGQTEETGLGMGWLDAVHPDDAARSGETFVQANATHAPFQLDYRLRHRDGSYGWAIDAASPRFSPLGAFLGYIGSVVDITDRKRVEDERETLLLQEQQARAQAEDASRLKDEFLATVSHELRTPLSSMLGWVQMLRSGKVPAAGQARALETIERNARAQAQLIEDLLDVSRILSGKLRLDVETVDLEHVVSQALETVRPAAEAKEIRLQAALDPLCTVPGDAGRLQQVVWNLLSNAVKFTPKGGRVQVLVQRLESAVELSVVDTGRGIEGDFLPHVFERFRQAESGTTRSMGGLGLGLSIVKHLVEAHGGTIAAASAGKDRGSTFTVRLPMSVTHSRDLVISPALDLPSPAELDGLRILVVDDEADTREVLRTLLEGCKARVRTCTSGAEGLRALEAETFDVLVSDIGMPDQDGYSFIRMVRELDRGKTIAAIALTAYTRSQDRTRALMAGFHSHVPKPVEPIELIAVIAALARDRPPAG